MINAIRLILTSPDSDSEPVPTFVLFSRDLADDLALLTRFVPLARGRAGKGPVRITWTLPDPEIRLGEIEVTQAEAANYQAVNRSRRGIQLLLLPDNAQHSAAHAFQLESFYVDWAGALESDPDAISGEEASASAPVTGLAWQTARRTARDDPKAAFKILLDDVPFLVGHDGRWVRHASFALHEAALIAERSGQLEAWEYFETVALMIYPNCHDALIGLAMRVMPDLNQAFPLFSRAYAIRPHDQDLRLFAHTLARAGKRAPAAMRDLILDHSQKVDLGRPVFKDQTGRALVIPPAEVCARFQALIQA